MIGRALRAQAAGFGGDVVLLGAAAAAFVVSLSVAAGIPPELAGAPADLREALAAPFGVVLATYGAVLAAVYGSFRYTIDRRDGVIAQRLTVQPRWVLLLARLPAVAVGGALVALAGVVGGHVALAVAMGGVPVNWSSVGSTLVVGAVAGLWGMGIGLVVQSHLVALFVAAMSMAVAVLLAMLWGAGAVYLPLLSMLQAFPFDVTAVGIAPEVRLDGSLAALVAGGWVASALLGGGVLFLRRDVT
ncbi:hypothetical protein [Microbacterium sp. Se5.02b]|uniref:hypothetical protein n=1 Tax=Microbacterium sp. Se5.02b TaxID=2864103 RepID=UPI001C68D736|nr:hypothetical protein [Microbacterium sp. Se5.02b]QYM63551.1 hypothetical protein K1X59_15300 [Microbacterium sp. Se5.02b]